jgi:hypothetical protein
MTRLKLRLIIPVMALCLFTRLLHGDILYFDITDVVLTPPSQGTVAAGIDFLLDGSDDFLLTLDRAILPAGGTLTTLALGGTFPMATVFVSPDAGGPGIHHLSKFLAGESIGTPQNDVRRGSGRAFSMEIPSGIYTGDWGPQAEIAFAGLAIDGFVGPNFGWARLGIDHGTDGMSTEITLFDFAFEGVAFRPIVAGAVPEPAGLALLGTAALVVASSRRRASR